MKNTVVNCGCPESQVHVRPLFAGVSATSRTGLNCTGEPLEEPYYGGHFVGPALDDELLQSGLIGGHKRSESLHFGGVHAMFPLNLDGKRCLEKKISNRASGRCRKRFRSFVAQSYDGYQMKSRSPSRTGGKMQETGKWSMQHRDSN
jgi:hypothetical protein